MSLRYSGGNREELEKVLAHYSTSPEDSLKLKATEYLIENMPGHYTFNSSFLDKYYTKLDSATNLHKYEKKLFQMIPYNRPEYSKDFQIKEDIKCITAEFLIHHIELAFRQWQTLPWLQGMNFNAFKEYILPYRVENEPLDYWRDSISPFQTNLNNCIELYDDSRHLSSQFKYLFFCYIINYQKKIPLKELQDFYMDCIPTSRLRLFMYRIAGIPGAIDFTPHYGNRNGRHYWVTEIDTKVNTYQTFQGESYRMPKVYRRTFSHNPVVIAEKDEYVPSFFKDPFNKDVSELYFPDQNLKINIPKGIKAHHAYLTVFNGLEWKAVACTEISKHQAQFQHIGRGIVYLPVYFDKNGNMYPITSPIIIHENGRTQWLNPQKNKVNMTLTRKYPNNSEHDYWYSQFDGARFEASNDNYFRDIKHIHTIAQPTTPQYQYVYPDSTVEKRYWRLKFHDRFRNCDLADLHFYDLQGNEMEGDFMNVNNIQAAQLSDDVPLTYAIIKNWVGVDFGEPVRISKIRYLCRNDANGIYPDNDYELLYYCFPEGWISAGIKTAQSNEVTYENIPAGTLYWLRNLTEGQEERIFTYEGNKVVFW